MNQRRLIAMTVLLCGSVCSSPLPVSGQSFPEQDAWYFQNFKTKPLPWDVYRDTFIGIPPTRDPLSSGFDVLFYDQAYSTKLSEDGDCFGMSLLSLLIKSNGGYLGFCAPVPQYSGDITGRANLNCPGSPGCGGPGDPALARVINIVHGYQVNLPTLQFLLNIFAQHRNRDGAYAFDQFQYYKMKNDLTLVSITKDLNPADGGHTLVAYDAKDLGGGNKQIFVYDPNRTWADPSSCQRGWYQAGNNFISISGSSWSFIKAGSVDCSSAGPTWSGDPGGGGNLVITPLSVSGVHARSPSSLGLSIIGTILNALLLTGDGASIEQVTDANGKRLFRPATFEIDTDPATGMLNVLPWAHSDQSPGSASGSAPIYFVLGDIGGSLNLQIRSGIGGYTLQIAGSRSHLRVQAGGGKGLEIVTVKNPGTSEPSILLHNSRGTASYNVEFTQVIQPRLRTHVLSVAKLVVARDQMLEIGVANNQTALVATSAGAPVQYDLQFRSLTPAGEQVMQQAGVSLSPGQSQLSMPESWSNLRAGKAIHQPSPIGLRKANSPMNVR